MTEHLCITCPVLRRPQDPRVYERANCCEGCRARLRSLPADLLDAYVHLELERTGSVGAKVSGSRTPPLPLVVDALDLTLANHGTVEDDLVPLYERVQMQVQVRQRTELRDKGNDLLDVRGLLSPNGGDSVLPAGFDISEQVAPAVEWLIDEVRRLRAVAESAAAIVTFLRTGGGGS